jgi:hypothetical protein
MSADNWTTCPSCYDLEQKAAVKEHDRVASLYGAIPVDEFDAARAALPDIDPDIGTNFREDYEFYGASQGEVFYSYKGRCSICGAGTEIEGSRRFCDTPGRAGVTT